MNSSKSESECVRSYLLCQMSTNAYGGRRVSCVHVCVCTRFSFCVCVCVSGRVTPAAESGRGQG